jgi:uncharacterized protein
MRKHNKTALIIFAREPKDGKVKTRLLKGLPSATVLNLYKAFVRDVLNVARAVQCDRKLIYYAGSSSSIPFLKQYKNEFLLKRQVGTDLGIRMYRAFSYCRKEHCGRIVIIGTDCLTLTANDIQTALAKLNRYECVVGPTRDGGYYLIGLQKTNRKMFENIDWGTPSVLAQTCQKAKLLKKDIYMLRRREDIDTIQQLKKLAKSALKKEVPAHTRKMLKNLSTLCWNPD